MNGETTQPHTRLLRLGLAEPESREFWRHSARELEEPELLRLAFEERWFGSRSAGRVHYLIHNFQARFGAFPSALRTLHRWNPEDVGERRILCHWHLQLSDPWYRRFTSTHLPERMLHPQPTLDRNAVVRWLEQSGGPNWAAATRQRFASGLMSALSEVGFSSKAAPIRPLSLPRVSDRALSYLLYLLREVEFGGTLDHNPFLQSLSLAGAELEERLGHLPGIRFAKMGNVRDLHWHYPDLWHWAQAEL